MRINDVIHGKPRQDVVTIRPDATVRELISLLRDHNVGALVVSTDGSSVDGIVSERDVVRRVLDDADMLEAPVSSIMTTQVQTCEGTAAVTDLMQVMTEHRIRHVPVLTDGALTGIISIGDVVKSRIGELEFERDQLDNYLHKS
ncbi:CBS domain-containing protein [Nocardioides sp. JQ2195]|uniref:CBS domain-containing protein n=1 Tax=Nocardioides sp. JQ2195 TaxID=2592334 RepID=UPI00143E896B|nr:CBS domain-containing protein [Nocardioides sp. JQ2195]QIX27492.1 CBS domain-containing protein [Nocardioides sp. JQ2195]